MTKAIFILIFVIIISLMLTKLNEKFKTFAYIITFIGIIQLVLSFVTFFAEYDPLEVLKETLISVTENQSEAFDNKSAPSFEVQIPKEDSSNKETQNKLESKTYVTKAIILNIDEEEKRAEDNKLYITWTSILGQESYILKIEVDDPFFEGEKVQEIHCENNEYNLNLSEYPDKTLLIASVSVYDSITKQWVYSEPIHFTIY